MNNKITYRVLIFNDYEVTERAKKLGIMLFEKKITIKDLEDWIEIAEKDIPEQRKLFNWNID